MRKYVVALAIAMSVMAAWGASASAISSPQVFSLLDISRNTGEPINGFTFNSPPQAGDQFSITDDLYKWAGTKQGAHAGRVRGIGTFVTSFGPNFSRPAVVLYVVQAYLHGGSVLVEGYAVEKANGPAKFTLPVVGGTGIYDNARGYVTVRNLGNGQGNKSNVEIHVLP